MAFVDLQRCRLSKLHFGKLALAREVYDDKIGHYFGDGVGVGDVVVVTVHCFVFMQL